MSANSAIVTTGRTRLVELDALRGLAALNLIVFHLTYVYESKWGFSSPLGFVYPYGKYGVQLFFILSGLVNAMTLLKRGRVDDFLVARVARIVPPYWAALALNAVLVCCLPWGGSSPTLSQWLVNLTIMPNLFGAECIEPVTWTLQVEILFYVLLVGLFCTGLLARPAVVAGGLMVVALAVGLPLKHGWVSGGGSMEWLLSGLRQWAIVDYLPLLVIGVLLNEWRCGRGTLFTGLGMLVAGATFHLVDRHEHNPLVTIVLVAAVGAAAVGKIPLLRFRWMVGLSGISYSLYLLHNNLGCTVIGYLDPHVGPWPAVIAATGVVFLVAAASATWFELPLSRWLRQRWQLWRASSSDSRTFTAARGGSAPLREGPVARLPLAAARGHVPGVLP